jgi:hypothetical protein
MAFSPPLLKFFHDRTKDIFEPRRFPFGQWQWPFVPFLPSARMPSTLSVSPLVAEIRVYQSPSVVKNYFLQSPVQGFPRPFKAIKGYPSLFKGFWEKIIFFICYHLRCLRCLLFKTTQINPTAPKSVPKAGRSKPKMKSLWPKTPFSFAGSC